MSARVDFIDMKHWGRAIIKQIGFDEVGGQTVLPILEGGTVSNEPSKSSVGLKRYMEHFENIVGFERHRMEMAYLAGFTDGCDCIAEIYRPKPDTQDNEGNEQ